MYILRAKVSRTSADGRRRKCFATTNNKNNHKIESSDVISTRLERAIKSNFESNSGIQQTNQFAVFTNLLFVTLMGVKNVEIETKQEAQLSLQWGTVTARARCQLKSGKMLQKCSTDCT